MIAGALGIVQGIWLIAAESMIAWYGFSLKPLAWCGAVVIPLGIVSVGGGLCAVRQERFIFAIIGSICALLLGLVSGSVLVLGIISLVFIVVSKDEFVN